MKQMIKFEVKRMLRNPGFLYCDDDRTDCVSCPLDSRGSSCCEANG